MSRERLKQIFLVIFFGVVCLPVILLSLYSIWKGIQHYEPLKFFGGLLLFSLVFFIGWALHKADMKRRLRDEDIYRQGYKEGYKDAKTEQNNK